MVCCSVARKLVSILPSVVNKVELLDVSGDLVVRKIYGSNARMTGIRLPLRRAVVERRMIELLATVPYQKFSSVRTPRLYSAETSKTETMLVYVEGRTLRGESTLRWPKPEIFEEIGRFIRSVECSELFSVRSIFSGLGDIEAKSREILLRYKIGNELPVFCEDAVLTLGDVGLKNMLYDDCGVTLIDFEFARRETPGFDVGQLSAELLSLELSQGISKSFREALIAGYGNRDGIDALARRWTELFLPYYRNKTAVRNY